MPRNNAKKEENAPRFVFLLLLLLLVVTKSPLLRYEAHDTHAFERVL